jgi:hypothetical protein
MDDAERLELEGQSEALRITLEDVFGRPNLFYVTHESSSSRLHVIDGRHLRQC